MFVMPYIHKLIKAGMPIGVALLVVINVFVYFGLQRTDAQRFERASLQYKESILPKLELPRYEDYLQTRRETQKARHIELLLARKNVLPAMNIMQQDEKFMELLRGERVITSEEEGFDRWRGERLRFDALFETRFVERFMFKSDSPSLLTALTSQFLHSSAVHLLGNMVVLILIAPAVEALIGTRRFLLGYLLGGLGAALAFWAWRLHAPPSSLIGASGAIAATMGMFSVLFGLRKIPFFYFVAIYRDTVHAPALLALLIWLANEVFQLFFGRISIVYDAYVGGFLFGAAIAWLWRKLATEKLAAANGETAPLAPTKEPLERARRMLAEQRFDAARRNYVRVAKVSDDCDILRECWNVVGLAPTASKEYHDIVTAILRKRSMDPDINNLVIRVFQHYLQNARPVPTISPNSLARLAQRFLHSRQPVELERVLRLLRNVAPTHPQRVELTEQAMTFMAEVGDGARALAMKKLL